MDRDSMWAQVLRDKYGVGKEMLPTVKLKSSSSPIWREICRVWQKVFEGIRWIIGSEEQVRAWKDRWLEGEKPLAAIAIKDILDELWNAKVKNLVTSDGHWKWDIFQEFLPLSTLVKVAAVCPLRKEPPPSPQTL